MLSRLGLRLQVMATAIDERALAGEAPLCCAARLAAAKADAATAILLRERQASAASGCEGASLPLPPPLRAPLLAADTVVAVGDRILGKAADQDEARQMLEALSGRSHTVTTAYCLRPAAPAALTCPGGVARAVSTTVTFRALCGSEIDDYLRSGEWRDKAGAYAIQGIAAALITCVHGSYTNVVGLPLCEVVDDLLAIGALRGALSHAAAV